MENRYKKRQEIVTDDTLGPKNLTTTRDCRIVSFRLLYLRQVTGA